MFRNIMWRTDPLPGRDLKANNRTATVAVQRHNKHASATIELLLGEHVHAATITHAAGGNGILSMRSAQTSFKRKRTGVRSLLSSARRLRREGAIVECTAQRNSIREAVK
jgi:hypothetical protein